MGLQRNFAFWAIVCKTVRPIWLLSVCMISVLSVTLYCRQTVRWIKMKLGMEVGLRPGHIVGPSSPSPKGANGWMEVLVDLGPGDFVLDGDPAPPQQKGAQQPLLFSGSLLWPNGAHLSYCWGLLMVDQYCMQLCHWLCHIKCEPLNPVNVRLWLHLGNPTYNSSHSTSGSPIPTLIPITKTKLRLSLMLTLIQTLTLLTLLTITATTKFTSFWWTST